MSKVPVEDHAGLVKDMSSKAILTTDQGALLAHKQRRELLKRVSDLENQLNIVMGFLESLGFKADAPHK